jgi:exopolysaccharide production protein ExoZ
MSGHSPPGRDQLARIQMFRALAALMVVFGHAQHHAILAAEKAGMSFRPSHLLPWQAGVDLFFVISGFIIVHASRGLFGQDGATRTFMLRRLIRIVPLYWLCATAYLLISRQFGSADSQIPQDGWGIVASYLFWPVDLFRDGHARPFYDLGWTLNYEMFFYFVFALSLGLRRQKAVLVVGSLMVAVVGLGLLVPGMPVPLRFWSQPIILEFVLGMAIAEAFNRGIRLPGRIAIPIALIGLALLLADPAGITAKPENVILPNDITRLLALGLPTALILASLVLWQVPARDPAPVSRLAVSLGDASYALYLVHPFVIVAWRKLWFAAGLHQSLGIWLWLASATLLSTLVAWLTYRLFERPVTGWLTRQLVPRAPMAVPAR